MHIIFKILVLIGPDMVWLNVRENTDIKGKSCGAVQHQSLGGNLHDHTVTARLCHFCKVFLHQIGFGCSIGRRNAGVSNNGFYGSDKPGLMSRIFQNGFYEICCGGLSLRTCNSYGFQLCGRVIKPGCRNTGHGITAVFYPDNRHILWHIYFVLHHQYRSAFFRNGSCIAVSV